MRFLHIDPATRTVEELDLKLEANTLYTYFSSILIDELPTLGGHTIYTDANALSQNKPAYFIGEQIVLGDALVLGRNGFEEIDATLSKEELARLVNYDISDFYKNALSLLAKTDENLYKAFFVEHNGEEMELNIAWVLYFFNIADERTKEYFLTHLEKTIEEKSSITPFMQKMASAALKAAA